MRVVLPDKSELELPEGASGSMPRRRSGPSSPSRQCSFARMATSRICGCRSRTVGRSRSSRRATPDDPDALYVLRHSAAHLLAERCGALSRREDRHRPADRERLLLRLRVPGAIHESDLERIEEEIRRELAEGREEPRGDHSRRRARALLLGGRVLQDRARRHRRGRHLALHVKVSSPTPAAGRTCRTRSRSGLATGLAGAYWRGGREEHPADADLRHCLPHPQEDLDAYLERIEEAKRRDHRRLGQQLDLFHLEDSAPGMPFWHPKGMVLWNILDDLRRREEREAWLRRGEDAADVRHRRLDHLGPLGEVPRRHVPRALRRGPDARSQADELPGPHAALRLRPAQLSRKTCRSATRSRPRSIATSAPARCTACCASSTSRRTTRTSSAPASRSRTRSSLAFDFAAYLYELFGMTARFEPDAARGQARHG